MTEGTRTHLEHSSQLYPVSVTRPTKPFSNCGEEISRAYNEACQLFSVHAGASGAYVRRALELVLEHAGYAENSLAGSIKAANEETDADKKLPLRLRQRLDFVREIGNFALHIRRDGELAIVEITSEEVEACLTLVEDLIVYVFEDPAQAYHDAVALNVKLAAAEKKQLPLPPKPPFWTEPEAATNSEEPDDLSRTPPG